VASTPNLDALASRGSNGVLYAVGPGRGPSSAGAHWARLGDLPEEFPNRAVCEALGAEQEVDPEDVLAFAALRPAELRDGELWLTGRPGSDAQEEAAALVDRCGEIQVERLSFART